VFIIIDKYKKKKTAKISNGKDKLYQKFIVTKININIYKINIYKSKSKREIIKILANIKYTRNFS